MTTKSNNENRNIFHFKNKKEFIQSELKQKKERKCRKPNIQQNIHRKLSFAMWAVT